LHDFAQLLHWAHNFPVAIPGLH